MMFPYFTRVILRLPVALAYVLAIGVCIVLVHRRKDWPSFLALIGFAVLLFMNVLYSLNSFFQLWMERLSNNASAADVGKIMGAAMLFESTVAALAICCLAASLWLSLRRKK